MIAGPGSRVRSRLAVLAASAFAVLAYAYLTLPDVRPLRTTNPPTTAFMELREREAHASGKPAVKDQRWIPYSRISANLKRAVIVTEDSAFWKHEGIDYEQLRDAVETNWERGEFAREGSDHGPRLRPSEEVFDDRHEVVEVPYGAARPK